MNYQQAIVQQVVTTQKRQRDNDGSGTHTQLSESDKDERLSTDQNTRALTVYHNNYIETGINALKIGFPTLSGLLDPNDFRRLCYQYLIRYPKTCFDWSDYGHNLNEFILQVEALSTQPFLSDIAQLDSQILQIERLPDKPLSHDSFDLMQHVDFSKLFFISATGLSLTQSVFPIVELYQLVHNHNDSSNEDIVEHNPKASHIKKLNNLLNCAIKSPQYRSVVMWREQFKGRFTYCNEQAYNAFASVISKESIEQVFSHFDQEAALTTWLQTSIKHHQIIGVYQG